MFTGFASENTPAIQVWDFFSPYASTAAIRSVSLSDDCAPIQVFRTGATSTSIRIYLPTCPIEGKPITIVNQQYNSFEQNIEVYSSDRNSGGTSIPLYTLGMGGSIVLVYSKQSISFGPSAGAQATGWTTLNQSSTGAQGSYSAVFAGDGNKVGGQYSAVLGGQSNSVGGYWSAVVGGNSCSVTGFFAAAAGGSGVNVSGNYAAGVGGNGTVSSGQGSICMGGRGGTNRGITGNVVFPASYAPISSASGVSQAGMLVLGTQTTTDTATRLRSDDNSAGTTNQVILPNNSAYYVKGSIIATVTGGGNTKSWDFIATIKRGANAASTAIVGAVTLNVQAADAGAATWVVAITADTTNGGLAVTVTGQAATTIRWVAKLESTEVTF